jgi:hypothetical protein
VVTYTDLAELGQGSLNLLVDDTDPTKINLIEEWRVSERGERRAAAALLTIEQEWAELNQEAAAPFIPPPPAISTSAYADDGRFPDFEASPVVPAHVVGDAVAASTPPEHAPNAQRLGKRVIKRLRKGKATNLARKPVRPIRSSQSRSIKPARAARARAVHSHASHGGAWKAGDDGDGGDGEPPPPRWLLIADRSRPRIEVAAIETVGGIITNFHRIEATGISRAEALAELSRMVRERGGYPAWEAAQ